MFGIIARIFTVAGIAIALSGCFYEERVPARREVVVAPAAPPPAVVYRPAY